MGAMTETFETTATPENPAYEHRPDRLNRALAWVGIVAGSLFIVATVFFSGYVLGQNAGGGEFHHGGPHRMMLKEFGGPDGPMMGPGGPMMGPDDGPRAERLTPPSSQPGTPPRP